MPSLTARDLINSISELGTNTYTYYSGRTSFRITDITYPEGPISFLRWNSQSSEADATPANISVNQLATAASVFSKKPDYPIHFDRLFSAGGNSRSALETLLALTPNFFICYPQKSNPYTGEIEQRLKHLIWRPDKEHSLGEIAEDEYEQIISEVELEVNFGDINVADQGNLESIEAKRTHTQMQVALVEIGRALNFRTWIARNDRNISVRNTKLGDLEGVIQSLRDVPILYNDRSREAAEFIDCIWFSADWNYIPAVIEVEHSTGVTSGLTRMLKFKNAIPSIATSYTIVAPNDLRNKVVSEATNVAFRPLRTRFMPYSTVRELYGLIHRYSLSKVVDRTFIEPFMESLVESSEK